MKLNTGCSVVVPDAFASVIWHEPAPVAVTTCVVYLSVPDFWLINTTSFAAIDVLVNVNENGVAEPAADTRVIVPLRPLPATVVVRLVACVTATPAPVA